MAVTDTGSLRLEGGDDVQLAGVEMPRTSSDKEQTVPMAIEARKALSDLVSGKIVNLYVGQKRRDRYQRLLAYPCLASGILLQGWLLENGLARVATTRNTDDMAKRMLALERQARERRLGIWSTRYFRVRNPHETRRDVDSFQVVEGRVVTAAIIKGRAYLNFGPNWRTDFTFSIAPRDRRAFERAGIDLATLTGRRVRGRGWVTLRNGPMIELSHPAQLEILGE